MSKHFDLKKDYLNRGRATRVIVNSVLGRYDRITSESKCEPRVSRVLLMKAFNC
jgi:hypothetical protein